MHNSPRDTPGQTSERLAESLVGRCRTMLSEHLESMVGPAVETTRDRMLDAAEKAHSTEAQGRLVADFNQLRRNQDEFKQRLRNAIDESFRECFGEVARQIEVDPFDEEADLELVAEHELDEALAIDQMVHRLELRFTRELHAIRRRLAVLNRGRPVSADANPLGPHQIGRSLQRSAHVLPIEPAGKVQLLGAFEGLVLDRIGSLYQAVNEMFIEADILPNIRFEIERGDADPALSPPPAEDGEGDAGAEGQPVAESDAKVERVDSLTREVQAESQALLSQISSLLDRIHAGRPPVPPERVVEPKDMGRALRELQRQHLPEQGDRLDADGIKRRLESALSSQGKAIGPDQEKTIDLMGMVYDYLRDELSVIDQVRNLFEQLQLPLLRVAMSDGEFFQRENHPAREFFNTLSEAGDLWLGDHPEGSEMLERLRTAVADVAETDGDDVDRFGERLEDIRRHIALSARKAQLSERRQVQARKGQEKLRIARTHAQEITAQLVTKYDPPEFARPLIEEAWADYLALLHLRHGDDSAEWQQAVMVIRFIAVALRGQLSGAMVEQLAERLPEMLQELNDGLCQVGFTGAEADEAVARVEEAIHWSLEQRGDLPPEEQAKPMPKPAARVAEERDDTAEVIARKESELSPGERQELARLRLAAFGSWFEVAGDAPDTWRKRKLSWFSPVTGHCLLTDSQGRGEELTLADLARKLHAGTVRRYEPPARPLMERALGAVVTRLRRLTRQAADDEA